MKEEKIIAYCGIDCGACEVRRSKQHKFSTDFGGNNLFTITRCFQQPNDWLKS